MLVSGALHNSRGALFPALQAIGLKEAEVRRSWAAFRYGRWDIGELLTTWREKVEGQGHWQAHRYTGYKVKPVDITSYRRPSAKRVKSKHYDAASEKAMPGVVFGVVGRVGSIGEQRMALLTDIVRGDLGTPSEQALQMALIQRVAENLADDEMPVFDAGFKLQELQDAHLKRYVVRLAKNFTARRNVLPPSSGGRPPEYGKLVRPLPRSYKDRSIEATPPDWVEIWDYQGLQLRADCWSNLVLTDLKPSSQNQTFMVAAIHDPRFEEPWLLACPMTFSGPVLRGFYYDRWAIEQLPLAAKHMVGAHRQFVFADESCYRLPELSLLAGSILTYWAATAPPISTGFWDRNPKSTPGRLRRWLANTAFSNLPPFDQQHIRKKASVTDHLPKGVLAHRRSKQLALV